jgi:hypothetical protein
MQPYQISIGKHLLYILESIPDCMPICSKHVLLILEFLNILIPFNNGSAIQTGHNDMRCSATEQRETKLENDSRQSLQAAHSNCASSTSHIAVNDANPCTN